MVIKNQNGTKQREIVKNSTQKTELNGDGNGSCAGQDTSANSNSGSNTSNTVNVNTFNGFDDSQNDLDIAHGELTLYENEHLFLGQLYKTGVQLIIMQAIRVSRDKLFVFC